MTATLGNGLTSIELPTGNLALEVTAGPAVEKLCDFAARANPKRGFLIVSKVLGRHLPARPADMRAVMHALAKRLPADLPRPVVFLGMAETATALAQGLFQASQLALGGDRDSIYLQTSRQRMPGAKVLARFEEGHSHATTHMVQMHRPGIAALIHQARSLVVIDDESSTGNTFVSAANALAEVLPSLQQVQTVCITDWSGGTYLPEMPVTTQRTSLLSGRMRWTPEEKVQPPAALPATSNVAGHAPLNGMRSRGGLFAPESAQRKAVHAAPGERVLVLGDQEHSYEALLIAEEIELQGGIAAVQCITRSPALQGYAMRTVSPFEDAYGSGAPCYLYNILAHAPDRIIIACEVAGRQAENASTALAALGSQIPVEFAVCRYEGSS